MTSFYNNKHEKYFVIIQIYINIFLCEYNNNNEIMIYFLVIIFFKINLNNICF